MLKGVGREQNLCRDEHRKLKWLCLSLPGERIWSISARTLPPPFVEG
jgi:hypothetical protein